MGLFKKVLIANRSEIALRVQATCHMLDIDTVAVFSNEDRHASFVRNATESYMLTLNGYQGYLDTDTIIAIAHKSGADAIHPGYGFLSENASFAQKVIDAGLTWIGPHPHSITQMGDKLQARALMQQAGIPVIPGFVVENVSSSYYADIKDRAAVIGYPLIIKDPRGGGGKAMRCVRREQDFIQALEAVIAEANKLTGSSTLLIERYIECGRHIEIQVAGDGNRYVHMFERECSIQRRHQKMIEETPCNFIPTTLKKSMYKAALCAAQQVAYDSIGTVECIVTPSHDFYFLEMNTRLQVEHAVTEMTTGIDLVALQIHLAATKKLPLKQKDITQHGHAIQCRVYAEDPQHNFAPSVGVINHMSIHKDPFVRIEHDLYNGMEVTPFFDPMIAKCSAVGLTRELAAARLASYMRQYYLDGIRTNAKFLSNIISSDEFISGRIHTQMMNDTAFVARMNKVHHEHAHNEICAGIAALIVGLKKTERAVTSPQNSKQPKINHRRWKDKQWW